MSITGTILMCTGMLHCSLGGVVPYLRDPLLRLIADGSAKVPGDVPETYARGYALWFEIGGLLMIGMGAMMRSYHAKGSQWEHREAPPVLGWFLISLAIVVVSVLPVSGGWVLLALGAKVLMNQKHKEQ